jgi:hypothetical protein
MAGFLKQDVGVRDGKPEVFAQAAQRGPGMPGHRQPPSSTPPTDSSSSRVIPASMAIRAARLPSSSLPEVSGRDREDWVGTVHTMQGKEADVVILVLGGDPDRPGARRFAIQEPNLLNVAVTRAKRRLYVIGNRDTWGNEPYFNVLAASIPAGYPLSDFGRSPH